MNGNTNAEEFLDFAEPAASGHEVALNSAEQNHLSRLRVVPCLPTRQTCGRELCAATQRNRNRHSRFASGIGAYLVCHTYSSANFFIASKYFTIAFALFFPNDIQCHVISGFGASTVGMRRIGLPWYSPMVGWTSFCSSSIVHLSQLAAIREPARPACLIIKRPSNC